jgi:integrase
LSKNKWQGRIYLGRDEEGQQRYHWVGRYRTRRERDEAVSAERERIKVEGCDCKDCKAMGRKGVASSTLPTIGTLVDRYLKWYEKENRGSSLDTQETRLRCFRKDFADRRVNELPRSELKDWAAAEGEWATDGEGEQRSPVPVSHMPGVVSFFNWCIDEEDVPLPKNPARKMSHRSKGRSEEAPPTEAEFEQLIDACSVHGDYGPMMRATFLYASYQLARPSEVFELKETDIDFKTSRVGKNRRLYRGTVDEPKTGKKVTALALPARQAIAPILPGDGGFIFRNKSGNQLTASTHHGYWKDVLIRAGLDFDFYLASKHYGVWYFWNVLGLDKQVIAAQAGWSLKTVEKMLETYGHGDVGALEKIDAAFKDQPAPTGLRLVEGGRR